jgi:hypothetical protein
VLAENLGEWLWVANLVSAHLAYHGAGTNCRQQHFGERIDMILAK